MTQTAVEQTSARSWEDDITRWCALSRAMLRFAPQPITGFPLDEYRTMLEDDAAAALEAERRGDKARAKSIRLSRAHSRRVLRVITYMLEGAGYDVAPLREVLAAAAT